eukprot:10370_1
MKKDKMAKNTPKSDTSTNTTTRKATISDRGKVNVDNSCGDEVKEEQHRSKENKHKNVVTSGSLFSGGNDENLNGEQKMKHKIQIINKKCGSPFNNKQYGQNSLSENKGNDINNINNKQEGSVSIDSLLDIIVDSTHKIIKTRQIVLMLISFIFLYILSGTPIFEPKQILIKTSIYNLYQPVTATECGPNPSFIEYSTINVSFIQKKRKQRAFYGINNDIFSVNSKRATKSGAKFFITNIYQ